MDKRVIITALVFGWIFLVIVFLLLQNQNEEVMSEDTSVILPSETGSDTDFPAIRTMIDTTKGPLSVTNFLDDPQTKPDPVNPGHYFLGNYIDPTVDAPPEVSYAIEYIEDTNYFGIILLQEPLAESRMAAEEYLKQQLQISEEEMCSLKYMISVPNRVNQFMAGRNLGFSFCPGSYPLE